jgi:nucleoside-diphosphate-sugar epimerase
VILVTGGTGFVGRALVKALAEGGHRVALLTRDPERLDLAGDAVVRRGDLLDPNSLVAALDGVNTVVNLAAALPDAGLAAPLIRRINVEGSANLARAAARCNVAQFVHGSSAGVYGDGLTLRLRDELSPVAPTTLYERTKLEAERAIVAELSQTPVAWSILRPSGLHGPGRLASAHFYHRICHRPLWIHGPATVVVHPTYVGDVVHAILKMLDRTDLRAEVLNIAGPRSLTYQELIKLLASRLGVRVHQFQFPVRLPRSVATLARLEGLAHAVVNRGLDTTKARRLIGFEPHPLEAGIDETIAWARREQLL